MEMFDLLAMGLMYRHGEDCNTNCVPLALPVQNQGNSMSPGTEESTLHFGLSTASPVVTLEHWQSQWHTAAEPVAPIRGTEFDCALDVELDVEDVGRLNDVVFGFLAEEIVGFDLAF